MRRSFLSAVLAVFCFVVAEAQVVSFVKYGVENGLIQSQVQALSQDDQGRLWVGTISGISIYDGVSFSNYTTKDSLAENWITSMYKARDGDMWIGHWAGSISRYDWDTKIFEDVEIEEFNQFQTITDFVEDTVSNELIFASNGSGVFVYHLGSDKVSKINYSDSIESKFVTTIFLDQERNLWVGTDNGGVYLFNLSGVEDNHAEAVNLTAGNGLASDRIKDIDFYNGEVWIATADEGLNKIDWEQVSRIKDGNVSELSFDHVGEDGFLPSNNLSDLQVDKRGGVWVGTRDKGVLKIGNKNGSLHFQNYNTKEGLSFYDVNCMLVDREKSVWIGTNVGLNQYFSDYFLLYDKTIGLNNNIVWSVCPDGDGNVWLGTNSGVSRLINASDLENDDLKVQELLVKGLDDVAVREIYKDSDGNLWFATAEGRLYKRTPSGKFQKVNIENVLKDIIFSMQEDDRGNLWLGTRTGAARLDKETYQLDFFSEEEGLGGSNVSKIVKDRKGQLWFACSGGYLTMFDGENFHVYDEDDGMKPFVLCAAADQLGNLYFGAYTAGLYKYDGNEFTNYTTEHGMRSETPYALISDDENNLWIGTSYGVEKFNPRNENFSHYGKTEGFLGLEVNYNAIARDENENIWFGTILGAVKYNPSVDMVNDVKPIVKIPGIEIDQEPAEFPFNNEFGPEQNNLTFRYIGVSLNNSNKVRYQYQLEGYDNEWSKSTEFRQAVYSNLDPGKYNFKVKASNSFGIESDVKNYAFKIDTPFYMSYTFYGIQVGLIILMMVLAVFYGRKTGGSRVATVLATIALIIVFEYGINYIEENVEAFLGGVAFIKVGLNVLLALLLFPVEQLVKKVIIKDDEEEPVDSTSTEDA